MNIESQQGRQHVKARKQETENLSSQKKNNACEQEESPSEVEWQGPAGDRVSVYFENEKYECVCLLHMSR